jgi:hypothetical protein
MTPNSHFCEDAARRSDRNLVRWTPLLRYVALIAVVDVSTSCADDVVIQNPRTGMTQICQRACRALTRGRRPWLVSRITKPRAGQGPIDNEVSRSGSRVYLSV